MNLIGKAAVVAIALFAVAGCGSKDSTGNPTTPASAPAAVPDSGTVRIDYRAEPDPPRKGKNDVQVTVLQPDGTRVTDADVTVTYYMPAMPSMSMPEMRDAFPLARQNEGTYAGEVQLSMGGTWQVTVNVTKGGESVAMKRFTIIARE